MEHNQPSVNTFYEKYKDYGILSLAIPAASLMVVINTIGILANMTVIIITVSSKNLRSTTNYLLAMQCFFDSIHVLSHYYLAYVLYSGKNFDTLPTCLHVMTIPFIGFTFGIGMIFFIAMDRLIATLFPIKHQKFNQLLYLGSILATCMAYTTCILYLAYVNAENNKETMVVCLITEAVHGTPSTVTAFTMFALVIGAIVIYLIIGIYIRYKCNSSLTTKRLFKSLFILCIIMTCSWVVTSVSGVLCFTLGLSEELSFFIPLYAGIAISIACASNFFVLIRYSSEYRTAAKECLIKLGVTTFFKKMFETFKISDKIPTQKIYTVRNDSPLKFQQNVTNAIS